MTEFLIAGPDWKVGFGERNHIYTSPEGEEFRIARPRETPHIVLMSKTPGLLDTKLRRLTRRDRDKLEFGR